MNDSVGKFEKAIEALTILHNDLYESREAIANRPTNQRFRRELLRTFCTYLEASVFRIQQYLISMHGDIHKECLSHNNLLVAKAFSEIFDMSLSAEETVILNEWQLGLNEQGEVFRKDLTSLALLNKQRFLLNLYGRFIRIEKPTDYSGDYKRLKKVIEKRNKLTHPKDDGSITISDTDLEDINKATVWLYDEHRRLDGHQRNGFQKYRKLFFEAQGFK
jgi:hypothetical protein